LTARPALVAEYDPAATDDGVDLDPRAQVWPSGGRSVQVDLLNGQDVNTTDICPAALGSKDEQPVAFRR
jgi:hypothetical protein